MPDLTQFPANNPTPQVISRQSSKKLPLLIWLVVLVLVIAIALGFGVRILNKKPPVNTINKPSASSTQALPIRKSGNLPMYSFSGTITNITENSLTVEALVGDDQPPQIHPPKLKSLKIKILPSTKIEQSTKSGLKELSLQNLKKGDTIIIDTDLNNASADTYQALRIKVVSKELPAAFSPQATDSATPANSTQPKL